MTNEECLEELNVIYERLSHPEDCEQGVYSFRDGQYLEALDMAIQVLESQPKWIPTSERLPEESLNSVIGWDAYRERCVFVQYIQGRFQIMGRNESFDIKAWMPLPQPYKAESEDKE